MSKKRILVVDDSEADQFVAEIMIKKAVDADVMKAYDGQEALEVLEHEGPATFDAIFLDINMPRMDGHGFLAAYAELHNATPPVVVMLTSSNQDYDMEKCASYACVGGYQVKPLDPEQVRKMLA